MIEEEQRDGFGYDYAQLVTKIAETESVTQKTKDDLERFVTDRRWMGHHKSGTLTEANVVTVKQRLEILLQELFWLLHNSVKHVEDEAVKKAV